MAIAPSIIQGVGLPPIETEPHAAAVSSPAAAGEYKIPTVTLILLALLILFGMLVVGFNFGVNVRLGA
jgi:hypothetical protein